MIKRDGFNIPKVKLHTGDIELAVARHLNPRINLIVPNISWGLWFGHELDLIVVTQNRYAWEIEIKISVADLKADLKKKHCHESSKIKRFYFAVPTSLKEKALVLIPKNAGLFIVDETDNRWVHLVKAPAVNHNARKLNDEEIQKLYELAAMRIWSLKETIYRLQKEKPKDKMCFCGHGISEHSKYVNNGENEKGSKYVCNKDNCDKWNLCDL